MSTRDDGFSLVEVMVASMITLIILGALATTLISGLRVTKFGTTQSESLDGARLSLNQVAKDVQGSNQFSSCVVTPDPAGSCILIVVQSPAGGNKLVRYKLTDTNLVREVDDGTGTFPYDETISSRIANLQKSPVRPLFVCDGMGSLLRVTVQMVVQPNPISAPTYELQTVVRPRNTYTPPIAC